MKKLNIDRLLALLCAIMVLAAVLPWMSMSVTWGDDQAAYISDGIALAEGSYDEKIRLNSLLHPSPLIEGDMSDTRVYVWGYPLMQSVVYSLVGFDRVDYHTVIYYHLPGLICLCLLAAVLYLWFRRSFGLVPSFVMSLFFCCNNQIMQNLRIMYSDVPFLLFALLCYLLSEMHTERILDGRPSLPLALSFGLVLWYCCETRANGMAIAATLALGQLLGYLRAEKNRRSFILLLLPFILLAGLKFIFESFILYPSTPDVGEIVLSQPQLMLDNLRLYLDNLLLWIVDFPLIPAESLMPVMKLAMYVFLFLFLLGAVLSFREKAHYLILTLGTFALLLTLKYNQGVRYFFPVLPLMMMFAFTALDWIWKKLSPHISFRPGKALRAASAAALLGICLAATALTAAVGMRIKNAEPVGAYSDDAIEIYAYIQSNTSPDSVIAFFKPRFLYLNTQRLSFAPMLNGHEIYLADYYLCDHYCSEKEYRQLLASGTSFEEEYRNDSFVLYKIG